YTISTRKKATGEDREQRNVHHVSTKPVPVITLRKNRQTIVLFRCATAKSVLSPRGTHLLCRRFRIGVLGTFGGERLRGYELWRGGQLWFSDVLPGGRKTIN